ncbi:unnamed protein product, partial [Rotaria sordida]
MKNIVYLAMKLFLNVYIFVKNYFFPEKKIIEAEIRWQYRTDKINELIKELIEVCEDIPDLPSSYLNHIKKLNEDITLQTNEKYRANDIHKMLIEIENLINLINENKTQKILRILFCIEVITYQLLEHINQNREQISDIENDCEEIQNQLSDLKNDNDKIQDLIKNVCNQAKQIDAENKELNGQTDDLLAETDDLIAQAKQLLGACYQLNKPASNQVLKQVYNDLLAPLTKQIQDEFDLQNEEKIRRLEECYDFRRYYTLSTLEKIQSETEINDEPTILINNILQTFCNEAELPKTELLEFLLHKSGITYESDGFIDTYLYDVINGQCNEHELIHCIENRNDVSIVFTDKEKDVLIKLARVNIARRRNEILA